MVAWVFDASNIDPAQGAGTLPAGDYRVVVASSEFKQTRSGNGMYLEITNHVIDGPYKGRSIIDRFNVQNTNPQAVEIAMKELSALCRSVGILGFQDTMQLHGIPYIIQLSEAPRADDPTKMGNEIVARKDAQGNMPTMGGVPAAATAPAPAYAQPGPAVAPPAAAQPATPMVAPPAAAMPPQAMMPPPAAAPGMAPPPAAGVATPPWLQGQ